MIKVCRATTFVALQMSWCHILSMLVTLNIMKDIIANSSKNSVTQTHRISVKLLSVRFFFLRRAFIKQFVIFLTQKRSSSLGIVRQSI